MSQPVLHRKISARQLKRRMLVLLERCLADLEARADRPAEPPQAKPLPRRRRS